MGALVLVLVATLTTVLSVSWIWTKADAVAPLEVPPANPTPLKTITPSIRPTPTPPPTGKIVGSKMIASNTDTMPLMSSSWKDYSDTVGLYGGTGIFKVVHENYDGKRDWGNMVAFGGLAKNIPYTNTPAGRKAATIETTKRALVNLYTKDVKLIGKASHRTISVNGHPGHELTIKVAVKEPQLKETFSTVMVALIDRGDGTADVALGDFCGTTPQEHPIWRTKVSQIEINR